MSAKRELGPAGLWSPLSIQQVRRIGEPQLLRPGIDMLRIWTTGAPLPQGTEGRFIAIHRGYVALQPRGWKLPVLVWFEYLEDHRDLLDPISPDALEFAEGYVFGWDIAGQCEPIGVHAKGQRPSWNGRGVARGHMDHEAGRQFASFRIPLNDAYRFVERRYPDELPPGARSPIWSIPRVYEGSTAPAWANVAKLRRPGAAA